MKNMKIIKYLLGAALGTMLFAACETYAEFETVVPENPVMKPVRAAWAEDGDGSMVEGLVDQEKRTISFSLYTLPDLSIVKVRLDIPKRVELISPDTTETVLSLPCQVVVRANGEDIAYDVIARLASFRDFDTQKIKEYRLDNDCWKTWEGEPLIYFDSIFDGKFLSGPGQYGDTGYRNFQFRSCQDEDSEDHQHGWATVSFDFGEAVYLHKFTVHPHWYSDGPYYIRRWDVYGFCGDGEPSRSGKWSEWTNLGGFNEARDGKTVWPNGDSVVFDFDTIQKARYYRLRCLENRQAECGWGWADGYCISEIQISIYHNKE